MKEYKVGNLEALKLQNGLINRKGKKEGTTFMSKKRLGKGKGEKEFLHTNRKMENLMI